MEKGGLTPWRVFGKPRRFGRNVAENPQLADI
jgi:hypothetical protein